MCELQDGSLKLSWGWRVLLCRAWDAQWFCFLRQGHGEQGRSAQPSCMLYCSMSSMRSKELESWRLMVWLSREEAPSCSTCS